MHVIVSHVSHNKSTHNNSFSEEVTQVHVQLQIVKETTTKRDLSVKTFSRKSAVCVTYFIVPFAVCLCFSKAYRVGEHTMRHMASNHADKEIS